ncbi:MAG: glycosyltransferase [Rhodospirillales bacterium]
MKILYVADFNESENAKKFYDINRKLSHGFVRNGHAVFHYSDRDVARASTVFHSRKFGVVPANKRLVEVADIFRPDLIFLGHANIIKNSTLRTIRSMFKDVHIAYRNIDPLFNKDNVKAIMRRADEVDAIFVTTAGDVLKQFERSNNIVSFMPNPVDRSIETNQTFRHTDLDYDLFFAIGGSGPLDIPRIKLATDLKETLPEVRFDFRGMPGRGKVWGADYQDALGNARMGLNLSKRSDYYLYSSDRMPHLTGNGLLTFIDRSTGFNDVYSDDELAFYDSFDDLVEKIRYYKANDHERRRVAENGWRKSHASFNERLVAKYIIETIFHEPLSEDYAWPTRTYTS